MADPYTPQQRMFLAAIGPDVQKFVDIFAKVGITLTLLIAPKVPPPAPETPKPLDNVIPIRKRSKPSLKVL